jgi:hypothetical protein
MRSYRAYKYGFWQMRRSIAMDIETEKLLASAINAHDAKILDHPLFDHEVRSALRTPAHPSDLGVARGEMDRRNAKASLTQDEFSPHLSRGTVD